MSSPQTACGRWWAAVTLDRMQIVAETPVLSRQIDELFSDEEKHDLIDYLAENPLADDENPRTRKQ